MVSTTQSSHQQQPIITPRHIALYLLAREYISTDDDILAQRLLNEEQVNEQVEQI